MQVCNPNKFVCWMGYATVVTSSSFMQGRVSAYFSIILARSVIMRVMKAKIKSINVFQVTYRWQHCHLLVKVSACWSFILPSLVVGGLLALKKKPQILVILYWGEVSTIIVRVQNIKTNDFLVLVKLTLLQKTLFSLSQFETANNSLRRTTEKWSQTSAFRIQRMKFASFVSTLMGGFQVL